MFPLGFWSGSIAIRYASYHFQNRSVPTPLRYENHAEKNLFQWKQKAYPIWKLERNDSDPVWWKHSNSLSALCPLVFCIALWLFIILYNLFYDNRDNKTFECYVVSFNHEQILLHITKLKLMLNYWGFVIRNISVISELFWKKIFSTCLASIIFTNS